MIVVNSKHTWLPLHTTAGELVVWPSHRSDGHQQPQQQRRRPTFDLNKVIMSDNIGSADIVAGTTAFIVFSMSDIVAALEGSGGGGTTTGSSHKNKHGTTAMDDGLATPPRTRRGLEHKIRRVLQREGVSSGGVGVEQEVSPMWTTNRLVFLVHSDIPEPPSAPMTWVNMAALDAQAKLMIVWTQIEASAVLGAFLDDVSTSYARPSSGNGGGAGPFSLLPFKPSAPPHSLQHSPPSTVGIIVGDNNSTGGDGNNGGIQMMTQGTAATLNLQGTSSAATSGISAQQPPSRIHPTTKSERATIALATLTKINGINRTDAVRLLNGAKTFADILMADVEVDFAGKIPELSKKKAARLDAAFNAPFPNTSVSLGNYMTMGEERVEKTNTTTTGVTNATNNNTGAPPQQPITTATTVLQQTAAQSLSVPTTTVVGQSRHHHPPPILATSQNQQPFVFNNPATAAALKAMMDAELDDEDDD